MSRSAPWKIADVLDFEYLLGTEAELSDGQALERDRKLFTERIARHLPTGQLAERSAVFRWWLELRRASMGGQSPGSAFDTGWQTLLALAVLIGFFLGGGVTAGVLHYRENEPVNAIEFLKWTLLPQWLFLLGALTFLVLRRALGLGDHFEPLRALLRGLINGFAVLLRRLPGEKRAAVHRTVARVREHRERYGALAAWPVVIATQLFAVCFNLGALGTLLTEVTVRELRFGWQTTLEVDPRRVAQLVEVFAWPWGWAPQAHPSPDQIAATRYAPAQRHETLPAEAMRSWWPFLAYALAFYGLGVRGTLLLLAVGKLRGALRRLDFNFAEANALWHRMAGPVIVPEESLEAPLRPPREAKPEGEFHAKSGSCWVLVAQELEVNESELSQFLERTYGWQVTKCVRVRVDHRQASAAEVAELRGAAAGLEAVVVVAPAKRDPIVAIALFVKEVLGAVGKNTEGLLLLAGSKADLPRLEFWRDFKAEHQLNIGIAPWMT